MSGSRNAVCIAAARMLNSVGNNIQSADKIQVTENNAFISIKGKSFKYCLDKRTGLFAELVRADKEFFTEPMDISIWRAPVDNDMYIKQEWIRAGYDRTRVRAYDVTITEQEHKVVLKCSMSMSADAVQRILNMDTVWTVFADGAISMEMKVRRCPEFPYLPRFGLRLFMDTQLEDVLYYGMGPTESYCDKHHAASHGIYVEKIWNMYEDYIRPQEKGSHYDCSYVTVKGEDCCFSAVSENAFSMNASIYTQEELTEKAHNFELQPSEANVLCLDYAQSGVGSNSCGPDLAEEYRLDEKEFDFCITLLPGLRR